MRIVMILVLLGCTTGSIEAGYVSIDLSAIDNTSWTTFPLLLNGSTFPSGPQQLGAVPFNMPGAGKNVWSADVATGGVLHSGPTSVIVPINTYGATTAYMLINNEWGQPGHPAFASLTFTGSAGTTLILDLLGNYDIRDYNNNQWTNQTSSPATQQVWQNGLGQRLDMQTIDLQGLFLNQTLLSMTLTDRGDHVNVQNPGDPETKAQRTFLSGVTVNVQNAQVPEPGTIVLLSIGLGLLLMWRGPSGLQSRDSSRLFPRFGADTTRES